MSSIGSVRWALKKASRSAVTHGSDFVRNAIPRRTADAPSVRALTYHRFGHFPRDPFCISPVEFSAQMRELSRSGRAISLSQLHAFLDGKQDVPRDAVLVTIDDGFMSLKEIALPILRRHRIPAVAFVSAGLIGSRGDHGPSAPADDYLDWRDLELLNAHGVSIQSHGWSHHSLGYLGHDEMCAELSQSKKLIEDRLDTAVTAFAYPFGTRADFNPAVAAEVAAAGYRFAFTSQHGPIQRGDDSRMLTRIKVESGDSLATFGSLVHGGMDAWRWIDRGLWRLQASRRGQL